MRNFIDIVEAAFAEAYDSLNQFGTGALARRTDPNETIDFKIFADHEDLNGVEEVLGRFPSVTHTLRDPSKLFAKYTFLCRGKRHDAEAISRSVKMARLRGSVTRID